MSSSKNDRVLSKVWLLLQAALWIETRASVPRHPIRSQIAPTTVQELHQALKAGTLTASGCVDGGERRTISAEEWNDYRLRLNHTAFPGHHYTGSSGTPVIAVLSIRSFPAAVLKDYGYPSRVRVPSARSSDGEPAYHRVITDVLLREQEIMRQWPGSGRALSSDHEQSGQSRATNRPARERALNAIKALYPSGVPNQAAEPNVHLCRRVCEKLKATGLPGVSDDTILRAAGRRK
jgi:hypothetical protein